MLSAMLPVSAPQPDESGLFFVAKPPSSRPPSRPSGTRGASGKGPRRLARPAGEGPRRSAKSGREAREDTRRERAPARAGERRPPRASGTSGASGPSGDKRRPPTDKRRDAKTAANAAQERRPVRPPRKISHGANLPRAVATPKKPGEPQRIAKLLARAGIASRRDVERMIADGRIARDGVLIDTPATLLTSLHGITVDGNPVKEPAPAKLFRFHKPAGTLTAARDPKGRPTIYDRLPADLPRLMPIGRLDYNTEGLLLLTTDGELKRQMELPSSSIERTYRARAFGEISQTQLEDLVEGIEIDGIRYGKIDANLERRTGRNQWIELTLTEGKNREVRRVLEHFGLEVSRLIRTSYGPFELADLPMGGVDQIRAHDLVAFRKSLGGGGGD
ncbi:pseudouridine synthase [Pseudonocardia sp. TMWB2A]|uniref:pseudouridine synthase n=1 Tax=Pseudonocardia sp. TMWB2A TaxID=687430 RepID=UPI00307EE542